MFPFFFFFQFKVSFLIFIFHSYLTSEVFLQTCKQAEYTQALNRRGRLVSDFLYQKHQNCQPSSQITDIQELEAGENHSIQSIYDILFPSASYCPQLQIFYWIRGSSGLDQSTSSSCVNILRSHVFVFIASHEIQSPACLSYQHI